MTAFDDKTAEISRTPIQLVAVTLDTCSLVYSEGDCTAGGGPELVTGDDSDMSAANNWTNVNLLTLDISSTVHGKMYLLNGVGNGYANLAGTLEIGKEYRVSLKARLKGGLPEEMFAGSSDTTGHRVQFTPTGTEATYSGTFTADGTGLRVGTSGILLEYEIDDVLVQEILSPGGECYNTFFTCQDRANFDKTTTDFKYTSFEAPIPFSGIKPYIKTITTLPTRIEQRLTVKGRRKIKMVDELSDDINIDPYFATRSSVQGEYWKKLVARNPNYNGRQVKIYEGYFGLTEAQFEQRWTGTLENIDITAGLVTLSCVDNLAELVKLKVPDDIKTENLNALTDSQTTIVLSSLLKADGVQIDSSGYVRIDDEIIGYAGLNVPSNQLTGCTRGALETTAATHDAETIVSLVKYYAPDNPFDIIQGILNDAGIDNADIDTTAWAYWKDWPKTDIDYSGIITTEDSVTAQDLFWEIVNLLDCQVWQDEDQLITIRRVIANEPGRVYTDITDTANIIINSGQTDYNEQSRRTRFLMYWGKEPIGNFTDVSIYGDIDIAIDADAEGANGYDSIRDEVIFCRWFSKRFLQEETVNRYAANLVRRKLLNRVDALPLISVSVELKDEGLKTGGNVVLTTDEILQADGNPISENYEIILRDQLQGKLTLQLVRFPKSRICFIAVNGITDYATATTPEREYGFISNDQGEMPNGDASYNIW